MSNFDSESSDFWNLSKKEQVNSESSDFWNMSTKKNYKNYTSEDFSSEDNSEQDSEDDSEQSNETSESKEPSEAKQTSISFPNLNEISNLIPKFNPVLSNPKPNPKPNTNEDEDLESDLTSVKVNSTPRLPLKEIVSGGKKFSDYTFKEFYQNFMTNVIGMTRELKNGKGINTIFSNKDRLIHFGIVLIIISILLVPLTLN